MDSSTPRTPLKNVFDVQKSTLLILAIILFLLSYFFDRAAGLVGASFLLCVLIYGNARRIPATTKAGIVGRWVLYVLPLAIPALFLHVAAPTKAGDWLLSLLLGSLVGIPYLIFQVYKNRLPLLDKDIALMMFPGAPTRLEVYWSISTLSALSIAEELFFRSFIFSIVETSCIAAAASIGLFVIWHFVTPRSGERFSKRDYLRQLTFAVFLSAIYLTTASVVGCVVLHLSHNAYRIMLSLKVLLSIRTEDAQY